MSEYSITQEQIDGLLNEVSIEDRIQNQFAKIKNKISRMLYGAASRDLMRTKKELGDFMKSLEKNRPFSVEFIATFKAEFNNFSREILQGTQDYALFEHLVKLENMIGAMFYKVEQEKRRYPRFPLTIDLLLTAGGITHTLFGVDISSVGISFYAPLELTVGRRYSIHTPEPYNEELMVDVLRAAPVEPEHLNIWRTACVFPNLLTWERIRDIIVGTMENQE
jgi:tetrahydromethanopterin S-methyltransferase subunit B